MAHAARDTRIARIRAEEGALAQIDARFAQLQREELNARATLAAAQANVDAITAEMRAVKSSRNTLESNLDDMRSRHRRDLWTNVIPLDVLQHIFELCTVSCDDITKNFGHDVPLPVEARMPFVIATTCSLWRKTALSTPRLWTYIWFRAKADDYADITRMRERAKVALARSKNASLDILLSFKSLTQDRVDVWTLIGALTAKARRIRSFELWLPNAILRAEAGAFDPFKAPTPVLERLCIIGDGLLELESSPDDGSDWGAYFMHAPKLTWIEFQLVRMSCPPGHRFETLQTLMLWSIYPHEDTQRMVAAASSTLQCLFVGGDWGVVPIQQPLSLPVLLVLGVYENLPMLHHCIIAPRVNSIELHASVVVPEMGPFLDHFADRVTTLTVAGTDIPEDCLGVLQALRSLETLVCKHGVYAAKWNGLFDQLAESPDIWPKLRSIRILKQTGNQLKDGFLKLVRNRSKSVPGVLPTGNPPLPARLVEVDIADSGAPAWLCASVQHLLKSSVSSRPLLISDCGTDSS